MFDQAGETMQSFLMPVPLVERTPAEVWVRRRTVVLNLSCAGTLSTQKRRQAYDIHIYIYYTFIIYMQTYNYIYTDERDLGSIVGWWFRLVVENYFTNCPLFKQLSPKGFCESANDNLQPSRFGLRR